MTAPPPPVALTIAGSDPSGGAGIQADLKTFSALGVYGTAVITALTAQSTRGVTGVHLIPASFVTEQLRTLVADVRIDAVKIGMLATAELADATAEFLLDHPHEVVVLDPVMVATSGDRLIDDDAVDAVRRLFPLASLITPNLPEAAQLLGVEVATDVAAMREQARRLVDAGAERVLVKGGHLAARAAAGAATGAATGEAVGEAAGRADGTDSIDVLVGPEGCFELVGPRIATRNTHGTGCTLSAAVAALRPQRPGWLEAVRDAKSWLTEAIAAADTLHVGQGSGPVHHFHRLWPVP